MPLMELVSSDTQQAIERFEQFHQHTRIPAKDTMRSKHVKELSRI